MNKKIRLLSTAVLTLLTISLSAETLRSIRIEGLTRTQRSTVMEIIRYRPGDQIRLEDREEIRRRLVKSGLFIKEGMRVELVPDGDAAELSLYLKDKITLVPIPVLSYTSGAFSGGLFVAESNLFGRRHQLFFGGLYGADAKVLSLGYFNPSVKGSPHSLSLNLGLAKDELTILSVDGEEEIASYDNVMGRGSLGWGIAPDPFFFKLSTAGSYRSWTVPGKNGKKEVYALSPQGIVGVETLRDNLYFQEGWVGVLSYQTDFFTKEFETAHTVKASASYQMVPVERLQLQLSGDLGAFWGDSMMSLPIGGFGGTILPQEVRSERFLMATGKAQFAAADFSWGYLALPLSYQAGVLDGVSGKDEFFHGPSGGVAIFLKKVAIPAFSLLYAYNMETMKGQMAVNLGISL